MSTSGITFESLPAASFITTTNDTVLPLRQIEDIPNEIREENNDDHDDYVNQTTLHMPGSYWFIS